jgi:hypothetical protein
MPADERNAEAQPDPAQPPSASEQAFASGNFRTLRTLLRSGVDVGARARAALTVDPMHVAVLLACALGLIGVAVRYMGVEG